MDNFGVCNRFLICKVNMQVIKNFKKTCHLETCTFASEGISNTYECAYVTVPVYDHTGDVIRLVDNNGNVKAYYEYDAHGRMLRDDEVGACGGNRFKYRANWIELGDSNGRFYLSKTRIYDTEIGAWLGRDRINGIAGGYVYAADNPMMFVDPDGRKPALVNRFGGGTSSGGGATGSWGMDEKTKDKPKNKELQEFWEKAYKFLKASELTDKQKSFFKDLINGIQDKCKKYFSPGIRDMLDNVINLLDKGEISWARKFPDDI